MNTKRIPIEQRFNNKVNQGQPGQCWLWGGAPNSTGYGTIRQPGRFGKTVLAHRLAYEISFGVVPEGMCVCHRCDVPLCVNPGHLFLGSNLDNIRDRDRKGRCKARGLPGEGCGHHKLKEWQVIKVLKDSRTHQTIADAYHMSRTAITNIKLGRTWKPTFLRTIGKWTK